MINSESGIETDIGRTAPGGLNFEDTTPIISRVVVVTPVEYLW
jgi:hypothetical protein